MSRLRMANSLAVLFCLFGVSIAHGDLIYTIQDYPAFQNGHSLSGTITTLDTAPDDGLLMSPEIVDWSFSVTGPNGFSLFKMINNLPEVTGVVNISPTEITIGWPLQDPSVNEFQLAGAPGGGQFLRYLFVNDIFGAGTFEQYEAHDANNSEAWQTFPAINQLGGGQAWVIATAVAVPEPSPVILLASLSLPMIIYQRRRMHNSITIMS